MRFLLAIVALRVGELYKLDLLKCLAKTLVAGKELGNSR